MDNNNFAVGTTILHEVIDKSTNMFDHTHNKQHKKSKYKNPAKTITDLNNMLKEIKRDTNNVREDVIEQYCILI